MDVFFISIYDIRLEVGVIIIESLIKLSSENPHNNKHLLNNKGNEFICITINTKIATQNPLDFANLSTVHYLIPCVRLILWTMVLYSHDVKLFQYNS